MKKKYPLDLTGERFGRLLVIKHDFPNTTKNSRWICLCDCGNITSISRPCLIANNHTRSCGCYAKEVAGKQSITHGMTNTVSYRRWVDMHTRCYNKNIKNFKNYGGRGITVCKKWHSFQSFYNDMGDPPINTSIERLNNNLGYSKNNCKWATIKEQGNNRRNNIIIEYKGYNYTISQLSEHCKINYNTLYQRIKSGWDISLAVKSPIKCGTIPDKLITHEGHTKTRKEWSLLLGNNPSLVSLRLKRGWNITKAITTKPRGYLNGVHY